ncbi:nitrite reductase small subunit NirD [Aeromicrobium terrae]|uniref:Nitrite reductase small subunit NirD n=1 Tax=Aeromicrobium terrae TaxID=2498846 RepID=A0A5C8NJ84_9ACTN|nr:nitrite reductase small subunit NirD [Aeromicrobium terrae]TXL61250.1 nitrite reductase small subunit NirD [Aeromicrobium terrae]
MSTTWQPVCPLDALVPDRGAAALVTGPGGEPAQVALFRLSSGDLHAVGHRDPFSGANVIARGLVGSAGEVPVVISPLHKQAFDLRSGAALDDPEVSLGTWDVRVVDGQVEVRAR